MKTLDWKELQEERFQKDPEARAEWEREALARALSIAVIRFRAEHNLSQSAFARLLGMRQPNVARLEMGEHTPSIETLARLSASLGWHILLEIAPAGDARSVSLPGGASVLADEPFHPGTRLLIAAGWPAGDAAKRARSSRGTQVRPERVAMGATSPPRSGPASHS